LSTVGIEIGFISLLIYLIVFFIFAWYGLKKNIIDDEDSKDIEDPDKDIPNWLKRFVIRIGLILGPLGLITVGVANYGPIISDPTFIIIGILLLVLIIYRWKDLENIGK
jgi:hypothetical protein